MTLNRSLKAHFIEKNNFLNFTQTMWEKLKIGLREENFFLGKEIFYKFSDFNKRCENELEDKNKKHALH